MNTLERSQINNLTSLHLKDIEKEKDMNPKLRRRKEITKIKMEINEIKTKKTIEKINVIRYWIFGKINKIEEYLDSLTKKKRGLKQIR